LRQLVRDGKHSSRKVTHACILLLLLLASDGLTEGAASRLAQAAFAIVKRTRKRFVEKGLGCLNERPRRGQTRKPRSKPNTNHSSVYFID
jgi:hypothetical protein